MYSDATQNKILEGVITETSTASESPPYKFMVNSTILQLNAPSATSTDGESTAASSGRRGMHSAAGAYWNNAKDGMWSYKYEGGEKRGMDVVVCVMWVGI